MSIHTDSSLLAETTVVNGQKQLKLKSLAVTDVVVDSASASLAAWITANYANGNELQEGDMLILTGTTSARTETYIHNGGSAGDATDFVEIQGSDISASEVRGLLSAGEGIVYNSSTGVIEVAPNTIKGFFSAGSGLAYNSANGVFSLNTDTDGISEGTSNVYFTDARARLAIGVSGAGLSYASATGLISLTADTDDISEGTSNVYFTDARARLAIGVSGSGLSYASATGLISLSADTDDVTEGTNLYYTDSRARGAIQLKTLASPDVNLLAYDGANGDLSVSLAGIFSQFSAGTGLSWDGGGEFSLNASTDNVTEGTNLYYTDSRARGAIQADSSVAQNLIDYDSATGDISVDLNSLRKEFTSVSLTANTFFTLNHGLGKKFVHVSAYDANSNLVMLDVQLTDTNNLKVKAGANKTGLTIIVSV
jgi:hypothetical protein